MATRKQQKRRHQRTVGRGRVYGGAAEDGQEQARTRTDRKGRPSGREAPHPPSWRRTGRRALAFAVVFLVITQFVPIGHMSNAARAGFAVYIFLMMWLAGMMTDGFIWRRYAKKQQESSRS
jgi:hypothetical protein